MIRADQIPDEVVEAAASDIVQTLHLIAAENGMTMTGAEEAMDGFREVARATIAAALNAWPGIQHKPYWDFRTNEKHTELILPVPQKEKGGQ
jgi:hypothetical protein